MFTTKSCAFRAVVGLMLGAVLLCGTTGCASSRRAAASQPALPDGANAMLMDYISDQALVTAEPACRAIYTLWKGDVFEGSYADLLAALRAGNVLPGGWNAEADAYLDRATVAVMLCRACEIRTGVNWLLTGLGRYAWRELIYHGIARGGSEWTLVSGGEFLGLLVRADDYLVDRKRGNATRLELGDEPTTTPRTQRD